METKFKRHLGMFIACVIITYMFNICTSAIYTGSSSNPFPIRNMIDFKRTAECMRVNKNWSNGKHFSLQCDIEINPAKPLAPNSTDEYKFSGIFHGNGHTITLPNGGNLFGYINKDAVIDNLTVTGKGYFAESNNGMIKNCNLTGETSYIVNNNSGTIQDCKSTGKFQHGIANQNNGTITRCLIDAELSDSGIANSNSATGKISHCRVKGIIKNSRTYIGGLLTYNYGLLEDCTVDAVFEGSALNFYLVYQNYTQKEVMARRCTVGRNAKGTNEEMMFFGQVGNVEECGYEDWDQTDHCNVK